MEEVYTQNEISHVAQKIINPISLSKTEHAILVCLSGDLGAGKTTLVQEIALILGIKESVVSPTYVIMKKYASSYNDRFKNIVHIDAYRLESDDELFRLGWDELMSDPHTVIFLEWPERVPGATKNPTFSISLTHHNQDSRKMTLVGYTTI